METYDPTSDILAFRDYRAPWVRIESADRIFRSQSSAHPFEGETVRPLAYNDAEKLILLYRPHAGWPLAICQAESANDGYGHLLHYHENIWSFDHNEQPARPVAAQPPERP